MIEELCTTEEGSEHEITVGNYTTTHFYMCGSAQKVMSANKDKKNRTFSKNAR